MAHADDQLTPDEQELLTALEDLITSGHITAVVDEDEVRLTPTQKGLRAVEDGDA